MGHGRAGLVVQIEQSKYLENYSSLVQASNSAVVEAGGKIIARSLPTAPRASETTGAHYSFCDQKAKTIVCQKFFLY